MDKKDILISLVNSFNDDQLSQMLNFTKAYEAKRKNDESPTTNSNINATLTPFYKGKII